MTNEKIKFKDLEKILLKKEANEWIKEEGLISPTTYHINVKGHFKADDACAENVLYALKKCHDACIMLDNDLTWGRHEIYRCDKENKDMHYINLTTLDWSCAHGFIKVNLEFPVKWLGYQGAIK